MLNYKLWDLLGDNSKNALTLDYFKRFIRVYGADAGNSSYYILRTLKKKM